MPNAETIPTSLSKLIKKRDAQKRAMTSLQAYVDKFDSSSKSITQLQTRLEGLIHNMSVYNSIQAEIEECDDCTTIMLDDQTATDDFYYSLKAQIVDLIEGYKENLIIPAVAQSQTLIRDSMKLPHISAPVFDGDLQKWVSFLDTFNAMFHNNQGLSDVQRLHYLKSCLTGSAADVIRSIPTTDSNYHAAYDALVARYENKSLIIQSHIRSLFLSPQVLKPVAAELRNLHHHVTSQVRALRSLKQPVESWDAWLVTLVCSRLDPTTVGEWQLRQTSRELPTFDSIEQFLSDRVSAYEVSEVGLHYRFLPESQINIGRTTSKRVLLANEHSSQDQPKKKCVLCNGDHRLVSCERFSNMSVSDRKRFVFNRKLCYNCLYPGHQVRMCRSSNCLKCNQRHHTKLHDDSTKEVTDLHTTSSIPNNSSNDSVVCAYLEQDGVQSRQISTSNQILLATAIVLLADASGQPTPCRAILDSGSQVCLMTNACAKKLNLKGSKKSIAISGVSSTATRSRSAVKTAMLSRFDRFSTFINFHVLEMITNDLPVNFITSESLHVPSGVVNRLADPQFGVPSSIDILLGAEIFFELFTGEIMKISPTVKLHNTTLGWIITGSVSNPNNQLPSITLSLHCSQQATLTSNTQSICNSPSHKSQAEIHFKHNVSRDSFGRFLVKLPFSHDPMVLGNSRVLAQQRFYNLERKLAKNPSLASDYKAFMDEYLNLGHMELAQDTDSPTFYLPHHPVFKSNSSTTKLRVVFDGSAITKSGKSLNDILICGPIVQPSLISIILRFRMHKIALTADIAKMYRQIRVSPEDCDMQRICYRDNPSEPLKNYRLLTVTYGTRAASFLATRCLLELSYGIPERSTRRVVQEDFYVDDLLSGCSNKTECYELFQKLSYELNKAGLPLRKWCSNSTEIMNLLPNTPNDPNYVVSLGEDGLVNTLGLSWHPSSDCFRFFMKPRAPPFYMSKRSLLSDINCIFDPIGLISPVLIKGKIFLQQLWAMKMSWDQQLPGDIRHRWIDFYSNLQLLNNIHIPRRVMPDTVAQIQIHAFSDASQSAYGSCVYFRAVNSSGVIQVCLLASRSRVAPLKLLTIPRLELCAALLSAELTIMIIEELKLLSILLLPTQVYYWSDSSIVIGWIKTKCLYQAYVSNRVARILELTSPKQWHHVSTRDNPADLISRGIHPNTLSGSSLWWKGPQWLSTDTAQWPCVKLPAAELPEVRKVKLVLSALSEVQNPILLKYSRWIPLLRTTAWLRRFVFNLKLKSGHRIVGPLTVQELQSARDVWIRFSQRFIFARDFRDLTTMGSVSNQSTLKYFHPFIDTNGLIRVGGRIDKASLPYSQRHPLLLPSQHKVTHLLLLYEHERLLHAGPQALLAQIRRSYWPMKGKFLASRIVRRCIVCFRFKPSLETPLMAPLPAERVTVSRPFSRCGVDFCGPVLIKSGIRRVVSIKAYISVFVCFSTRAIHLELVSDLSTQTFLAALTRFMSRRGLCSHIHSDNGTNFVGASKALKNYFSSSNGHQTVMNLLANQGVQWHFIPPSAPHFGGLWEAAVKSAKHHLFKATKGALLKFEEMNTLLCRIEAILNSRPLIALSSDPSDLQALTPGHFLIGGPLLLPDEPDASNIPPNRLRQYELVRAKAQIFWKRWSCEYLPQLQKRGRWTSITRAVRVGDVAILKDENTPPLRWRLVVVSAIHPGADGIVRVVTVKSSIGAEFRRPVVKLALLPNPEDEESSQT